MAGVTERGVVAAGHPLTAQAGADVLRAGGNAVDAALAALMTSFMTEPLLTGLGAGGYMLVAPPGGEPVLLDFMVAAPGPTASRVAAGRGRDRLRRRRPGLPHRRLLVRRLRRARGRSRRRPRASAAMPLTELAAPAIALRARRGRGQPQRRRCCGSCSAPIAVATRGVPRALLRRRARAARGRRRARSGPRRRDRAARVGRRGAVLHRRHRRGGVGLGVRARRDARRAPTSPPTRRSPREPVRVRYHGREVLTNPPPSAGGLLIAYALALLERGAGPARTPPRSWRRWRPRRPSARRSSSTTCDEPGFTESFMARGSARPPTSPCSTPTAGRAR